MAALTMTLKPRTPKLTSPWWQNFVSGIILFLTVGIYLALTGLGAGGGRPSSIKVATTSNSILYVLFVVCGIFGGGVLNTIGPKWTMTIGAFGYPFYVSSLWYYDARGQESFPLIGGAVLGICASLLWTCADFIQFAYGEEAMKATYIAWQLCLLSIGATVGSLVAFGINLHDRSAGGVPSSVYISFILVMCFAMLLAAIALVSPELVVRSDSTNLARFNKDTRFRSELVSCVRMFGDKRVLWLIVPIFATEFSLALIPTLAAHVLNLRTRSLNNVVLWAIQISLPFVFCRILDNRRLGRRTRGTLGVGITLIVAVVAWALVFAVQIRYKIDRHWQGATWDWTDPPFVLFVIMTLFIGVTSVMYQMLVMWILSAFTNDLYLLARFGGMYKAILSAGTCVAFGMEAGATPYLIQTIIASVLMVPLSGPIMFFSVNRHIKCTPYHPRSTVIPPCSTAADSRQSDRPQPPSQPQ